MDNSSMKSMSGKIFILIISMFYCFYLVVILVASYFRSSILNPLNSEYYYRSGLLIKAVEAEPTKAMYHLYYGFELLNTLPKVKSLAQNQMRLAKVEFSRAAKLNSYNDSYKKVCSAYVAWINEQIRY